MWPDLGRNVAGAVIEGEVVVVVAEAEEGIEDGVDHFAR